MLCLSSCNSNLKSKETTFLSIDITQVKKEVVLPISELIESLEIIHLENKEEAFVRIGAIYVANNFVGVRPYGGGAYKLFAKNGKFIGNVGNRGQGPGEYSSLYHSQICENTARVYLTSYNADKILTYDLKGNFLAKECIPLMTRMPKGLFYVDTQRKIVTILNLPFKDVDKMVCWTQDFDGKILQFMPAGNYAVIPDYSNEVTSYRNTEAIDFFISLFSQSVQDTLYHYNPEKNKITPVFTLNAPRNPGKITYQYVELPNDFLIFIKTIVMGANPSNDVSKTQIIQVNKKTHEARYVRVVNDFLGDYEIDPFFLSFRIRDGYFTDTMEPELLKDYLREALKNDDLQPDIKTRMVELNNKLHPNDNNVIMIGKLKQ